MPGYIALLVRGLALVLFVVATGNAWLSAQTFVDRQTPTAFRVVSYNVYWDDLFNNPVTAPDELERMIVALDADVYCFQECAVTTAGDAVSLFNLLSPLSGGASWQGHKARNQIIVSRHPLSMFQFDVPNGMRGIAMALVDLPDAVFGNDLYILNNHFPCCENESQRQHESRVIIDWMNDAKTVGGNIDLPPGTAISVLGDLNAVEGSTPIDILLDGYNGLTSDWDSSSSTDSAPLHNAVGPDRWTWRNDNLPFAPGVLDFILFTDSVLKMEYGFVLNPSTMTPLERAATGLLATDFMLDKANPGANVFDHLPVVVDFLPTPFVVADASKLLDGQFASGSPGDTANSDDQYLELAPSPTANPIKQKIDMIVQSQSDYLNPDQFSFRVEASMNGGPEGDVLQVIRLFNYSLNAWDIIDSRSARTVDEFLQVPASGTLADYVHPLTREITAKVTWTSPSFAGAPFSWDVDVDQLGWVVDGTNASARKSGSPGKRHKPRRPRPR